MKRLLNLREARHDRHNQLWYVIRFAVAYYNLENCEDFYDYKKSLADFKEAHSSLVNNPVQKDLFEVVFRFFRIKNYLGECEHSVSDKELFSLINWEKININHSKIISNILSSYKEYWDDVLASYKRSSSRNERRKYLIQKLEAFAEWPELKLVDGAVDNIRALHDHYSNKT